MESHNEDATTIDNVMRDIYHSCDENNRNLVKVSKLIEYITPYMQSNIQDLLGLRRDLDPTNCDPEISSEVFFDAMKTWADKYEEGTSSLDESFKQQASPRTFIVREDKRLSFGQSTPRKSFGCKLKSGNRDSNLAGGIFDKGILEDTIKELNYQNKKCHEELDLVKVQLACTEEQYENLQKDNKQLIKQLQHEREINEQIKYSGVDCEEIRDAAHVSQKRAEKMEKLYASAQKEIAQLKEEMYKALDEKENLQDKLDKLYQKTSDQKTEIISLQTELGIKDKELSYYEEVKNDLITKIEDHRRMLEDQKVTTECVKVEKDKLESMLKRTLKKCTKSTIMHHSADEKRSSTSSIETIDYKQDDTKTLDISSSDDEMWRMVILNSSSSFHEDLQTELAQLNESQGDSSSGSEYHECTYKMKLKQSEHRILQLQYELQQMENNELLTNNYKLEAENLKLIKKENEAKLDQLQNDYRRTNEALSKLKELERQYYILYEDKLKLQQLYEENAERVKSLTLELTVLKEDYTVLHNERDELKQRWDLVEEEKVKIEANFTEILELKDEIGDKINNTSLITQQCQIDTNCAFEQLQEQIETLTQDADVLKQRNCELLSENENLKESIKRVENDYAQLKHDSEQNQEALINEYRSKIEYCQKTINSLESELQAYKQRADDLEKRNAKLLKQQSEFNQLSLELTVHKREIQNLRGTNKDLLNYKEQCMLLSKEMTQIQLELNQNKVQNDHRQEILEETTLKHIDSVVELGNQIKQIRMEFDHLLSCNEINMAKLQLKNAQIASFEAKQFLLENDNHELLTNNETLIKTCAELRMRNNELNRDIGIKLSEISQHLATIETQKMMVEHARLQIDNSHTKIDKLESELILVAEENEQMQTTQAMDNNAAIVAAAVNNTSNHQSSDTTGAGGSEPTSSVKAPTIDEDADTDETSGNDLDRILLDSEQIRASISSIEHHSHQNQALIDQITELQITLSDKSAKIKSLEERLRHLEEEKMKRHNYDRMILQLDKMREKFDNMNEQLNNERKYKEELLHAKNAQHHEINALRRQLHTAQKDVSMAIGGIHEHRVFLHKRTLNIVEKHHFTDDLLDLIEDKAEQYRARSSTNIIDELYLLKMDVELTVHILDRISDDYVSSSASPRNSSSLQSSGVKACQKMFSLKPAVLMLERPISPDSPNLEIQEDHTNTNVTADSIDFQNCEETIKEIQNLHILDNLGQTFDDITDQKFTEQELEEKFHVCTLAFAIDAASIKKRCQEQFQRLEQAEKSLVEKIYVLTSLLKQALKETGALKMLETHVGEILNIVLNLSRLGEQFGELRQEHKQLHTTNVMINYITLLTKKLGERGGGTADLKLACCNEIYNYTPSMPWHLSRPTCRQLKLCAEEDRFVGLLGRMCWHLLSKKNIMAHQSKC